MEATMLPCFEFPLLGRSGIPGVISVFGEQARAVITTAPPHCDAIVATAHYGLGRVVAISHEGYLVNPEKHRAGLMLWESCVRWAGSAVVRDDGICRVASLGREDEWLRHSIEALPSGHGFTIVPWTDDACNVIVWVGKTGSGDVVSSDVDITTTQYGTLLKFVESGGGLVVGMCPWGFEQITGRRVMTESAQNHILMRFGLAFTNGYASGEGDIDMAKIHSERAHAGAAIGAVVEAFQTNVAPKNEDIVALETALRALPLGRPEAAQLTSVVEELLKSRDASKLFANGACVARSCALDVLEVTWLLLLWRSLPPERVPAAPNAEPCRGERESVCLALDGAAEGWLSTGVYVPPGEVVVIDCMGPWKGWTARVGCHSDELWGLQEWRRWPQVSWTFPLHEQQTRIASPFGGLLYFEATGEHVSVDVMVSGVVRSPWFDATTMTEADWVISRHHAGPWSELAGKCVIITLPSSTVRDIEHPKEITDFWDRVVNCHCELNVCEPPSRRERLVVDVQISAGYMHSGYPIMMHMDHGVPRHDRHATLVDIERLKKEGNWGVFHELGHNQQHSSWTFDGTVEVTCNLFTLFTMQRLCGIEPWDHPWLQPHKRTARDYIRCPDFGVWKADPGLALVSYVLIQRALGWDCVAGCMTACGASLDGDVHDEDKMDAWVKNLSLCCGHNLCGYYRAWGMPLSPWLLDDAALLALPEWNGIGLLEQVPST